MPCLPSARRLSATLGLAALLVSVALLPTAASAQTPAPDTADLPAVCANSAPGGATPLDGAAALPVHVEVTTLLPRAPSRPDERLEVSGRLTSCADEAVTDLTVRLAVGAGSQRIDRRSGLAAADEDPVIGSRLLPQVPAGADELAAGTSTTFSVVVRVGDLRLGTRNGVYPLALQTRGRLDGAGRDVVGQATTFLPWFPDGPIAPTRIAWLLPLVDQPRRGPGEVQLDDELDQLVSDEPGERGRLFENLLSGVVGSEPVCEGRAKPLPEDQGGAAEGSTRSAPVAPCRDTALPRVPVTYGVDPDLLFTLRALADRPYLVREAGKDVVRPESDRASRWLTVLADQAQKQDILALPYGDPDVTALARSGTGLRDDIELLRKLGVQTTSTVLGSPPMTALAWPPPGPVGAAVDALAGDRTAPTALVLDETVFAPLTDTAGRTPSARVSLSSAATGEVTGLVADAALSALTAPDPTAPTWQGARLAEQRWLAEAAALTAERPSEARTIVVAPPRRGALIPAVAVGALHDTARLPFLCPVALADVAAGRERCPSAGATSQSGPGTTRLPPQPPAAAEARGAPRPLAPADALLRESYVDDLAEVRRRSDQFTDEVLLAGSPEAAKGKARLLRARGRAESAAWRDDPAQGRLLLRQLSEDVATLRGKIRLLGAPVLLTGRTGTVALTVQNGLDQPVNIGVRLDRTAAARLVSDDIAVAEVPGGLARQIDVEVTARTTGRFQAEAVLVGRDGEDFGEPVTFQVTSSGYGPVALGVTGLAAAVLFLAVGVRLVRRALGRSREPAEPAVTA